MKTIKLHSSSQTTIKRKRLECVNTSQVCCVTEMVDYVVFYTAQQNNIFCKLSDRDRDSFTSKRAEDTQIADSGM